MNLYRKWSFQPSQPGVVVWLLFVLQAPLGVGSWFCLVWLLFSYFLAMGVFLIALKIKKAQKKWKQSEGAHSRYNFDCTRLKYCPLRFPPETLLRICNPSVVYRFEATQKMFVNFYVVAKHPMSALWCSRLLVATEYFASCHSK
jgi:hypothetical protein